MSNKKIQLMIIGAQKAGTSSLKNYLASHADIETHPGPEITYFVNDHEFRGLGEKFTEKYFKQCKNESLIIAKSVGVMYNAVALERVRAHNPGMTLVVVLRNPIERAYSAFWYARRMGWEPLKHFEDALRAPIDRFGNNWICRANCDYLARGEYSTHIDAIFNVFSPKQVRIYKLEDLRRDASKVCADLWLALGLNSDLGAMPESGQLHNKSAMPKYQVINKLLRSRILPPSVSSVLPIDYLRRIKRVALSWNERPFQPASMKMETRQFLQDHYKTFNTELERKTGIDVSSWIS